MPGNAPPPPSPQPGTDPPSTQEHQQYIEPALYPPDGTMLETAAAAANHEDAVALAAMQEAATIVMEAQQRMQFEQTYTYAAANAAYGPSLSRTSRETEVTKKRACPEANGDELEVGQGESRSETSPPKKRATGSNRVHWEDRLRQLQEYKEQHGDLLIPIRYKPSNLGKFVHNTREQYKLFHKQTPEGYKKKCSLTASRIHQLEELGFCWTTERSKRQNDDWQKRLHQLKDFREKHGHCMVPHGYPEDPSFAEWIHRQRTSYNSLVKDEENGTLTATVNPMMRERFQQLKKLGFNFTVHSDKWMDHWQQLKDYKGKHGDCQVPTHYVENPKLGRWVHTQRHQRRLQSKGKKSCMTQERIDLLDQLGFSWEVRPSLERPRATWQQRLEELQAYHKSYGNFLVDPLVMPQLHAWCHEQRNRLKLLVKNNGKDLSKRMNPERAEALQKIGFFKDTVLLDASAALGKIGGTEEGPLASTSAMTTEETSDAPPATMIASAAPPSMDTIHHSLANKDNSIHLPDADNATVTKPDVSAEEEWKGQEEGPSQQETECGADVTHFVISV